ncbi:hypothetical protein [Kitasatospora sp. NPDC088134]|uniref:hypothetical protein n=1 Tax=Kitasatospora sp. NPDC088134 TaxID=3364071 RepID=UPI003820AF13
MPHTSPSGRRPEPATPKTLVPPGDEPGGTAPDPRDRIPAPGPALERARFGDYEATTHGSFIPEHPEWARYRIVHRPTGSVVMDYATDPTHLPALLVATVASLAEEDPASSDLYSGTDPGLENVRRNAQALYESARSALRLA